MTERPEVSLGFFRGMLSALVINLAFVVGGLLLRELLRWVLA